MMRPRAMGFGLLALLLAVGAARAGDGGPEPYE